MFRGIIHTYGDGDVVFKQGDAAADLYVIRTGAVRIERETDSGPVQLALFQPGDFFGEMGLFSPGPRSATAVAVGDVRLEVIDKPTFMDAVGDPIVWQMFARMSERLRRMDEALDDPPIL